MRPGNELRITGGCGTKPIWLRINPYPEEVKAISIPAGLDGNVGFREAHGVADAGVLEEGKFGWRKSKE